jgi:uncharacterized protein (DUF4415 family)
VTDDRKRTLAEERAYVAMMIELDRARQAFDEMKLRWDFIPPGWRSIEERYPVRPPKTKITAAFDADVVKWFRSMGQGYQARMNGLLRAFMLATIAKEIRLRKDLDRFGEPIEDCNKPRPKIADL